MRLTGAVTDGNALMRRVRMRLSKIASRGSGSVRRLGPVVTRRVRKVPLPTALRSNLYRYLAWRPGVRLIDSDRLLLGGQNGLLANDFAVASHNLWWTSTLVEDGPHVALLRAAATRPLSNREILDSPYALMARTVIHETGNFFDVSHEGDLLPAIRRFAERRGERRSLVGRSATGSHVRVAKVRSSDYFQVIDGHHRVAESIADGITTIPARTSWFPTSTSVQDLVDRMSWLGGSKELYQPVDAPELRQSWTLVRSCTDRLDKMLAFLQDSGITGPDSSYLDVASCYGWFVGQMGSAGYDAFGIERDPLGRDLGAAAYGLAPGQIFVGDVETTLPTLDRTWDVVSCFSLLHHFALGRSSRSADELLSLLVGSTGKVLFLDTGQAHEEWFRSSLPAWDTAHIQRMLESTGAFQSVVDLGPDGDAVGPYRGNYGRHLFACTKTTS